MDLSSICYHISSTGQINHGLKSNSILRDDLNVHSHLHSLIGSVHDGIFTILAVSLH